MLLLGCIVFFIGIARNENNIFSTLSLNFWVAWIVTISPVLIWSHYETTRGLIIDGESLTCKGLWKKAITPQEIVAIKITRTMLRSRFGKDIPLTDQNGNQLYTMFLMKDYMGWWMPEKEGQALRTSSSFQTSFGEYAHCRVIYDQEVIDYLLQRNPNIIVF